MDKSDIKKKIDSMSIEELREIAGAWPGSDRHTFMQYLDAGVIWRHYWFGKDLYCDKQGNAMTQGEAEWMVKLHGDGKKIVNATDHVVSQADYDLFERYKRERPFSH